MGFEDDFKIPVSDTRAYRLFASSTVVPMAEAVAECIVKRLPRKLMMPTTELREGAFPASGNWTEEQTKLAFYFYCQTPFGKLDQRNPDVIALAKLLHRTPSALAMKCGNIASLDPAMRARGIAGLGNASAMDSAIWDEFHASWDDLTLECEGLLAALREQEQVAPPDEDAVRAPLPEDFTGESRLALVRQRVKQRFFRRAVLSGYRNRCCISGVSDARLLVASHIVPWREDASIRLHPGNGLCLSAIHDKAFDHHLFSLSDDYRVLLSPTLEQTRDEFLRAIFHSIADQQIEFPERFTPEPAFVQIHRETMLARH